ncbi:MAG: hypothetical protein JO122_15185 [Acetobacteraceae bacterium]|nr:hypothetical protein [Acetobacteraceae bacterium]
MIALTGSMVPNDPRFPPDWVAVNPVSTCPGPPTHGMIAAALETPNRERPRPDWRASFVGGAVN